MRSHLVTISKVRAFRKIMQRLGRSGTDNNTLKLVGEARDLLKSYDLDWEVVTIRIPRGYVAVSERRKTHLPSTSPAVARAAVSLNGRALLVFAVMRHPEWPMMRDTLSIDLSCITPADLIAIAQILKIDEQLIKLVANEVPQPSVNGQTDLFDNPNE